MLWKLYSLFIRSKDIDSKLGAGSGGARISGKREAKVKCKFWLNETKFNGQGAVAPRQSLRGLG